MTWKPNVTVAAVIHREGRYLMVQERVEGSIVYNQPAGHLERGETLAQAVCREVLEETARDFKPDFLVGVYVYRQPQPDITYLRFCFAGSCGERHTGRELDAGIIQATWMSRYDLESKSHTLRSPLVLRCIDDYLAGRKFPLEMLTHWPDSANQRRRP